MTEGKSHFAVGGATSADRGKYVARPPAANDVSSTPAFTLTADQLAAIVRGAVADALAESHADPPPALLDRNGLAAALGCCSAQIDKLRKRGMPHVRLGDSPRFEFAACLEWLRAQKGLTP